MIISEGRRRPSSSGRRGVVLRGGFAEEGGGEEEKDRWVDLSGMALASLPVASLNLATITKLDLSNNNLVGIPESLTARLLSVVVLDLHSNLLQALPFSIGCLSRLKILDISGNMLESLPKTIEDCKALEELIVDFNKLTALPDSIGFELSNLRKLRVGSNGLLALPSSLSHMTSLRILDARLNRLRSLPEDLENLSRLEILDVSQNFRYLRRLPPSVGLLTSLLDLDISYNTISALPESLACLGKLRELRAEGNPLVSPPADVMERGVEAVRQYLTARMNADGNNHKKSWIVKLVKCATFTRVGGVEDDLFITSSPRRRNGGLASTIHVGMFSPRRLFSLRSSPSRKSVS